LTEGGATATVPAGWKEDVESGAFECLDRGDADVRFVISHEGIVPEENGAPGWGVRGSMGLKPMIETFGSVRGERSLGGDAEDFGKELPEPGPLQALVGEAGCEAGDFSEEIDRAEETFPERESIPEVASVEQFRLEQGEVDVGGAFRGAGLAGEAIAESDVEFMGAERVWDMALFEGRANDVGPPSRRHDLLPGHDEGGAHGGCGFTASAASVALFQVADEGVVFGGEGQPGREGEAQLRVGTLAQLGVDLELS